MRKKAWWIVGLVIVLALILLSPLASPWPDGLERVARDHGFLQRQAESLYEIMPDYLVPGIACASLGTILAGAFGVLIVFGIALGAGYALRRKDREGETR